MTLLVATAAAAAPLPADINGMPRVRSSHSYIRAMIDEATRRSKTFRRLVEAIEATNGIVYIEHGECGHSARACLSLNVTPAAQFRILRVLVDSRQPDWDVMSSIGHELQHAVEVLQNESLTTAEAVYLFYSRESPTGGDAFETSAAIKAGNTVRSEVALFARKPRL
jgi:hypothetical protein